jgi:tetratricopeptide (TPR) repeat protein
VKLAKGDSTIGLAFNALADSLLLGGGRAPLAVAGARGTDLLAAWRAYSDGHAGLARWDLAAAEAGFRRAVELDPGFPHGHLWLAQVLDWEDRPVEEWGMHAGAALQTAQRLDPRNAAVARGLAAMAGGRYPQACGEFDALIAHDSLDFAAWYGRGECLARDRLVVRDARTASGWRFRASYAAAIDAYTRALRQLPTVHRAFRGEAYQRLATLLYTQTNQVRLGYGLSPAGDTLRFAARLSLAADTIVFVPYPQNDLLLGRHPETVTGLAAAVARTREYQGRIAQEWLAAFPGDADAVEAAGTALEQQGLLRPRQRGEASALELYARAGALSDDAAQRLRLAAAQVRVLLRLQEFEAARALADSVLTTTDSLQPRAATYLAALAVLTGRTYRAAALLRHAAPGYEGFAPDGTPLRIPPVVAEEALGLLSFAAVGAPEDSVRALGRRATRLVDVTVDPDERARVRYAALSAPFALAFPLLGRSALHDSTAPNYLLRLQAAALRRDRGLPRMLAALDAQQAGVRAGDIAVDNGIAQATLSLMLADTARAVATLDATLAALPTLSVDFLGPDPVGSVPQVGALVRAMALRARLAALANDTATAQRWARAVRILWANADVPLQSVLGQMQVLDRTPAGRRS